ncbi:MAG TPA: type I 3-dehydroquinate dehydratase [Tenuifilaceae bacterium]|nr:type I 3-dehydroquinate dehydratase [Tenuifilaceae bacterium]
MNPKICLSIGNLNFSEILLHLKDVALAEIRIDLLNLTDDELSAVFKEHNNLIATYRTTTDFDKMVEILTKAMSSGCAYIDIDIETPEDYRNKLIKTAEKYGCMVILSYHNFIETPSNEKLDMIAKYLFSKNAHIAKIACMAKTESECNRILHLYSLFNNLVAFAMGEIGKNTRIQAVKLGAPFTYASVKGNETAPGQMTYNEIDYELNK